jgi:hypothetical protein
MQETSQGIGWQRTFVPSSERSSLPSKITLAKAEAKRTADSESAQKNEPSALIFGRTKSPDWELLKKNANFCKKIQIWRQNFKFGAKRIRCHPSFQSI